MPPVCEVTPEHIACVRDSVLEMFPTMCGYQLTFEGTEEPGREFSGVAGIISLVGDVSWSLTLGLPPATALALSTSFTGFEVDYDSDDMADLVGELANILAGDIAARLDRARLRASLSLPTVARGQNLFLAQPDGASMTRMRFTSPDGGFWLTLGVAPTSG